MTQGTLLIENACILTGSGQVFPQGFLVAEHGRITGIGPMARRPRSREIRVIDAEGRYLLPGFINPHMHFYGALALGMPLSRMRSFGQVLEQLWWRLDEALTLEDVYASALVGVAACIRAGVTTVFDHHASYGVIRGSLMAIADAVELGGIRASLCYEISDRHGVAARDEALAESAAWLDYVDANLTYDDAFRLRGMVGLHASMTLSDETLTLARELRQAYDCGVHIHVAEGVEDVRVTRKRSTCTPVQRLARARLLDDKGIAAHCVHVGAADIRMLARTGVTVAHNPLSNLGNAVGIAPILKLAAHNVPIVIGTDGMSAGVAGDGRLSSVLHRVLARDAQAGFLLTAEALQAEAARLASKTFGMPIGMLRRGSRADCILLDAWPRTELTAETAAAHLLFAALDAPVRTTICNGEIVMQDHEILAFEESAIAEVARKASRALWKRIRS